MEFSKADPSLSRALQLHLKGDWGQAHMHRVCGWLSQEIYDRTGANTKIAIWTGRGAADAPLAVQNAEVDIAISTPAFFMKAAVEGKGPFEGKACPDIRALGVIPQTDKLIMAVRADHGVRSYADLREKKPPLSIATGEDDGVSIIGFAAREMMTQSGVSREELASWGGRYVEYARPSACISAVARGETDAVIFEAIMTERWRKLAESIDLAFLPLEIETQQAMAKLYDWPTVQLPAGYFRGLDEDIPVLEFSDFLVMCRSDLPEDVAYLLAWCLCERRELLERQYRHIPVERSPITYPLEPAKIANSSVEHHPGARRYYKDAGLI